MTRAIRLTLGFLMLTALPATALAQGGTTPFVQVPDYLARGQSEFAGFVSIEDDIDLFGLYRRGLGPRFDGGLRVGFTDAAGGGVNLGIDLRYLLARATQDLPISFAIVAAPQFSLMDLGNLFAIPAGVSLGSAIDIEGRELWLYGIPYVQWAYFDPDVGDGDDEFDIGAEIGAQLMLAGKLWGAVALTIQDDVAFALGLSYR
ncbi:MAG: hypothetical protein GWN99_13990 [Gemmatimonadetes bacterium]|uniref:Outer membrane protein beta-barrel domain-containing protein n=1 Tax=Candidatus Kutchimonas denitrificans TaxID=3056748 RepID=A0AAE5C9C0_9BACT|nr:hypothetical protein [Gemmatimonadota bacterium]NIR75331.1 hypothetical protein [Candidatus Kutchimonas denitrificans]NIS02157.1 hypothetical protein [Gemmatimonadota bacterium]NIT67982.1 hypothetical protein [Gemmatimonadota bacterium]NIU53976.1 hypothetical protein [Gemmatimonadota bacterium]